MSVDLPAPLSPTSAVTLPGYTRRSTPFRTVTGPNDFFTPTSSMIGSDMLASLRFMVLAVRTRGATSAKTRRPSVGGRLLYAELRALILEADALDLARAD